MFDDLIRQLKKLEQGMKVPVSIPLDDDGYMDRKCPSSACGTMFKILFVDWKDKVGDDAVYCPLCRTVAKSTEWNSEEQTKYIMQQGMAHVSQMVSDGLRRGAEAFNRGRSRTGFLTMSMGYKPGAKPVIVPISAAAEMRQKFTCEECGCRYSSIGAAFFCPACGHNSASTAFQGTVTAVTKTIDLLPGIRQECGDADTAEDTVRRILENDLVRLVGAFQRYAEVMFRRLPTVAGIHARKNVFQNLKESSDLWHAAIGKKYEDMLSGSEMTDLVRLFQQRHTITHNDGIVDADYLAKSGDTTYTLGQRLVVREGAVTRLAEILTKLAAHLRQAPNPAVSSNAP